MWEIYGSWIAVILFVRLYCLYLGFDRSVFCFYLNWHLGFDISVFCFISTDICLPFVLTVIFTGHWLLMDAMGMGLCVAFIAFVRLPSLKVSTLLLTGLLIYDVFWVFFSSYIFSANVMVKVSSFALFVLLCLIFMNNLGRNSTCR